MSSLAPILSQHIHHSTCCFDPRAESDSTLLQRRADPTFLNSSPQRIAGPDGRQDRNRHTTIRNSEHLSGRHATQVFRQVLLEFAYANVHVDTLL